MIACPQCGKAHVSIDYASYCCTSSPTPLPTNYSALIHERHIGTVILNRHETQQGKVTKVLHPFRDQDSKLLVQWDDGSVSTIYASDIEDADTRDTSAFGGLYRNPQGVLQVRKQ